MKRRAFITLLGGAAAWPLVARAQLATAGGLISYGFSLPLVYRRSAALVDKILSGMSPADIPVEIPTGWELVINRETARALGIEVPTSLLLRALAIAARR